MTTANSKNINLSPWQRGQSGNPSGRPRGTRDLAGYVREHRWRQRTCRCPGVHRQGRHAQRTGAGRLQAKEGPAGAASRPDRASCGLRKAIEISDTLYIFRLSKVHTVPESCSGFFKYFFKFRLYTHGQLWMHME